MSETQKKIRSVLERPFIMFLLCIETCYLDLYFVCLWSKRFPEIFILKRNSLEFIKMCRWVHSLAMISSTKMTALSLANCADPSVLPFIRDILARDGKHIAIHIVYAIHTVYGSPLLFYHLISRDSSDRQGIWGEN